MIITNVRGTLKAGCDVELTQRTVICGPNGSGKSTIVQSVELATTGNVSDFEGRNNVKKHSSLARLFPGDDMRVEAVLEDGTTFSWSMEPGKRAGSYKRPSEFRPTEFRWPVQELAGVLSGDASSISAWLEKQVGSGTREELLRLLPPELRGAAGLHLGENEGTDILTVAKEAKSEARKLRSAATRREGTVDGLVEGVTPPLLDSDREKMHRELNETEVGISPEAYEAERLEIERVVSAYLDLVKQREEMGYAHPELLAAATKLASGVRLVQQHEIDFPGESCWVCGVGTSEDIEDRKATYDKAKESISEGVAAYRQQAEMDRKVAAAEADLESKVTRFKGLTVGASPARRDELVAALAADDANRRLWSNAQAQRAEIAFDRKRADKLADIGKALDVAGRKLLDQKKRAFEDRVSAFLPEDDTFGVDLAAGRIGLVRDGHLHSALSGAEWSRVLLALASASGDDSTPCVLVPEDRAWDRDTLMDVMKALASAPFQIIIMSTVTPDPIEGWSCVTTG